jgi:hypothetical protein
MHMLVLCACILVRIFCHWYVTKISTDRKFSENIIVQSWNIIVKQVKFYDGKFVSANHIGRVYVQQIFYDTFWFSDATMLLY